MNDGGDSGTELIGLLLRERGNRSRIWATLAVILAALTAILLDAVWLPWATTGSRMLSFLGRVVACGVGLWFVSSFSCNI